MTLGLVVMDATHLDVTLVDPSKLFDSGSVDDLELERQVVRLSTVGLRINANYYVLDCASLHIQQ